MSSFGKSLTCAVSLLRRSGLPFQKFHISTSYTRPQSDNINATGSIKDAIDKIIKNNKVVVFMKGVPEQPRCGFSNAVVQILRMHGVSSYDAHDVLQDESLRQGVKDYSNWPTIPQVYINGEFVGGCDIMIQMHQNGELIESLKKAGIKSALVEAESDAPSK